MAADDAEVSENASHADRLSLVMDDVEARRREFRQSLQEAFKDFIEVRETQWILFENISADELSRVFQEHPVVVKAVTALCNIASRAIRRDLGFEVDTYNPRLTKAKADQLAGYVKPFLPSALALPTLEAVDDWWFIDKEMRASRGRFEKIITAELSRRTGLEFKKYHFPVIADDGTTIAYELDAAYPASGEPVEVGIDVKGISAPRDMHKRGDEITNKAQKFKKTYPTGKFGSVIHYPFEDKVNVVQRLQNPDIDGIVFAGDSRESIETAILALLPQLGLAVAEDHVPESLFDSIERMTE
jgi:hypothetical protein